MAAERARWRAVWAAATAAVFALPIGCGDPAGGSNVGTPSGVPSVSVAVPAKRFPRATAPWPQFVDATKGSGLDTFTLHAGREAPKNWLVESVGGGLIAFDADLDGDMDLLLPDGDGLSDAGEITHIAGAGARLFRNDTAPSGAIHFTDITAESGIGAVTGYALGGAACDFDGDGDQDVVIVGYLMFRFLRNRGGGVFEDATKELGFDDHPTATISACAFGDLNGDGLVDLYVANYSDQRALIEKTHAEKHDSPRWCEWRGHKVFCGPRGLIATPNRLYFQQPDHRFVDVSDTHLKEAPRHSFQPVMSDLDGDGDLDIYVANDSVENTLLVNDGTGKMTDRAVEAGVATGGNFVVQGSMGNTVADVDRDGRMDLAVTNFVYEYNTLYRNKTRPSGALLFEDVTMTTKFSEISSGRVCWGIGLRDFNADGDIDAFIAAGHVYIEEEHDRLSVSRYRQTNLMFRGTLTAEERGADKGRIRFEDVSAKSGAAFARAALSRGAVFPDLDDDGDSDIVIMEQHEHPTLLRNDGGNVNAWVRFDLRGKAPNTSAAGARVTVSLADGSSRIADVLYGSSFGASDDPRLIFGLGTADRIEKVTIRWPNGAVTTLLDLPVRTTQIVRQEP